MRRTALAFAISLSISVPVGLGGCQTIEAITGWHLTPRTKAGAEVALTVVVKIADEYVKCGKPGNLPCPNGAPASDLAVVNQMSALIEAAYAAMLRLREGTGTLDAVYAAIAAVERYQDEKDMT